MALLSLITNLHVGRWGRELVIEGLDDSFTRRQVRLVFRDCRDIHWSSHEETTPETEADFIGLCLGQNGFREPALITTDLFELPVLYGSCDVDPRLTAGGKTDTQDSVEQRRVAHRSTA